MELILKQSKKTYTDKKGNERTYGNLYLKLPNGKMIQIKSCFKEDSKVLYAIATRQN